ncbi:MAG: hypothetical protein QXW94_03225 [Desulfurococcaceae archaeon]
MKSDIVCNERKRVGGKLIKICLKLDNCNVVGTILTGDFFAEPIEKFEEVSRVLVGSKVSLDGLLKYVIGLIEENNIELCGLTLNDIGEALDNAINEAWKFCFSKMKT